MPTPVPTDLTVSGAIETLNLLGVLPVIALGAVIALASMLYKRFRK